jgi:hypothetical protein
MFLGFSVAASWSVLSCLVWIRILSCILRCCPILHKFQLFAHISLSLSPPSFSLQFVYFLFIYLWFLSHWIKHNGDGWILVCLCLLHTLTSLGVCDHKKAYGSHVCCVHIWALCDCSPLNLLWAESSKYGDNYNALVPDL